MPACDTLLTNARLADGRTGMALVLTAGRIAALLPPGAALPEAEATHDLKGALVLPALADGHMHLDKTLFGLPWIGHQAEPFRMRRIETDQRLLPSLPLNTEARAGELIRRCVAHGTGHIRTHVDITPTFGLKALEGVLAARAAHAHMATVQTVAFPQAGVMRAQGMVALMEDAIRCGADLVGGIDPATGEDIGAAHEVRVEVPSHHQDLDAPRINVSHQHDRGSRADGGLVRSIGHALRVLLSGPLRSDSTTIVATSRRSSTHGPAAKQQEEASQQGRQPIGGDLHQADGADQGAASVDLVPAHLGGHRPRLGGRDRAGGDQDRRWFLHPREGWWFLTCSGQHRPRRDEDPGQRLRHCRHHLAERSSVEAH
jgi:hypothetical protein